MESFSFTGSVVPIASYLMVRSEFDNGARKNNQIKSWAILLSLYWLEALDFFLYYSINWIISLIRVWINQYSCFITLPFMIDLTYWNFKSLRFFFSLSLLLPFIHIFFLFYFALQLRIFFVYEKKMAVATKIWPILYIISWLVL